MDKFKNTLLLILVAFWAFSCDKVFEYSIYSADVKDERKFTRDENLERLSAIEEEFKDQESFKIALTSDSHTYYNSLSEVVSLINEDEEVLFTLHGGDMTDGGILTEFTIFHNILGDLNNPYFTVIGNHDCLANGRTIYQDQYGPENYSFVFKNCKFVFFNDVVWEMNYEPPDYVWLINELKDYKEYDRIFVIAHIPPWSDQFTPLDTWGYKTIMDTTNVSMSIHGHHHDHYYGNYFQDSIPYLIIGAPSKDMFCKLTVEPDTVIIETVNF